MLKKLLTLALILGFFGAKAQTYLMNTSGGIYTTCTGNFYDSGNSTGTYQNGESYSLTFYPLNIGSTVRISFTSFETEDTYDGMMIYNGPSAASPLISSGLAAGNNTITCPAGSWRGTGSPGTITSTDASGALTIYFTSDGSQTFAGWSAVISCFQATPTFVITNGTATTCNGLFYDSGGLTNNYLSSEVYTYTIYPSAANSSVQVNFTNFNTEDLYDGLMIYNGPSTSSPLISSGLGIGTNATTCPAGSWRGTGSPGIVTSSDPSGALTFVFRSDGIVVSTGWEATITCISNLVEYPMAAGFYTTCIGNFTDSGGSLSPYATNENLTLTIYPSSANSSVQVAFNAFETEDGYDGLMIYNGPSTASPLISSGLAASANSPTTCPAGSWRGTGSPGTITSTDPSGALTFVFTSDPSISYAGWNAAISCISNAAPPVANFSTNLNQILVGGTTNFYDLSTNTPTSWSWSFPGGTPSTSTLQNPTNIQYNTPGCYPVTLTATNAYGSNTITAQCFINVSPAGSIYCIPNPTLGTSDNDFINGVTLNTISNLNTGAQNGPIYTYYNTFTTNLNTGSAYPLGIQSGTYATDRYAAWIDYNSDGDFDDLNEKLGEFASTAANTFYYINFTVPTGTTSGYKIMRVRCAYATGLTNMTPCTDYSYGETEDYIVNVVVPNSAPIANFTSSTQNINVGQTVNFYDQSTNTPTSWSWTFTGATTTSSNVQYPANIQYNVAGCYPVTLTASNAFGSNTSTQTCYINVTNPSNYCTINLHDSTTCTFSDNIQSFSITNTTLQNNNSGCTAANGYGYTNYGPSGNFTASLTRGQTYAFNLTSTSNSIASVWIDYNHNNVFEASEWTQISTSTTAYTQATVNILIPTNATLGTTGMRVRTRANIAANGATDACTLFGSGETEDYTITIAAAGNAPVASFSSSSSSICVGGCVTFTNTSTGTNPTYAWTFPGGTPTSSSSQNPGTVCFNNAGTYNVSLTVTNANGSSTVSHQIVVNPSVTVNAGQDVSVCAGSGANLNATSNNANATYVWTPSTGLNNSTISNPTATPTATTTYSVTASANGCSATDQVIVSVNTPPNINAGNDVSICLGNSTNLSASSSSPNVTYNWQPSTGLSNTSIANPVATPTSTTTYYVTVTSNGCTNTDFVVVTVNSVFAFAGNDVGICPGGSVTLSAVDGNSYSWSPTTGLSNPLISNPVASPTVTTTYTVTVTANGCTATDQVIVSVGNVIANAGQDVSICVGNSTNLSASGGTSYQWTPQIGLSNPTIANPIASPTVTTTYTVLVSNGACTATDQVVVTVNSATANAGNDVTICNGSFTQLNASGGSSYAWTPATALSNSTIANPTANPTSTTTYTVVVTNNGCTATDQVTVTVNTANAVASADQSICAGGSTTLFASGGGTYSWSPSTGLNNANIANPTASPIATTTYVVTVTINGCTASDNVTITVNNVIANAGSDQTICLGSNTQLSANGGSSYSWTPSTGLNNSNIANPTATPTATTTYTVLVSSNGCTATDQVTINVNSVNASAGSNTNICVGSSTQLLATGGTSFAWTPATGLSNPNIANPIASPGTTTTYSVTVTNGNCTSSAQVTVNVTNLTVNAGNDVVICPGQSGQLTATSTPNVTYLWSPSTGLNNANISNPTASPTQNTTYTVVVTQNGCTASDQVAVNINNFTANAGLDVTVCPTNSVQLNATGGTSYSWTPSTGLSSTTISNPLASPSVTTAYTVVVTNGNCTQSDVVIVTVGNVVANAGSDITLCSGQTNTLIASGGSNYSWSPATGLSNANIANPIVSVSQTTTYTVTVSSGTCISTDQVTVTVIPGITANAGSDLTVCSGQSVILNGQGGTTFSWSPSTGLSNPNIANPSANPTQTTAYVLTSSNGTCSDIDTVVVSVISLTANAGNDVQICAGQSVPLNATGGTNYSWSPITGLDNANIANPNATPTATTQYTVTVTQGACTATDVVNITVNTISVNAGSDISVCAGGSVQLTASSAGNISYSWLPSTGLSNPFIANPTASPSSTTSYQVVASDGICTANDIVIVTVNPIPAAPGITQNGSDLLSTTAASYQWYNNGLIVNGATSQVFTPTTNGSYTVEIVDANGCSSISLPFNFLTVSTNEFVMDDLKIYPNPNNGIFTISGSLSSKGIITIDLVNLLGEKIGEIYEGGNVSNLNKQVDLSNYSNGVYFVRLTTENGSIMNKIIKN